MTTGYVNLAIRIAISAVTIFAAGYFLPGVRVRSFMTGVWVALVNSILFWLIFWVVAPFLVIPLAPLLALGKATYAMTLGILVSMISLKIADWLFDDFDLESCLSPLLLAITLAAAQYFVPLLLFRHPI
jgi:uncharacterized membrane protein YvlD (DUF360 family)